MRSPAKQGESTILWWVGWICLTIATFFISCYFWTGFIAKHFGDMNRPGAPLVWVGAVFGSWLVLLVPLIIVMYYKVDKAYEDTRLSKESSASLRAPKNDFGIKVLHLDQAKLLLKKEHSDKLKKYPPAVRRGHLVTATLKDGRRIENIFVLNRKDILGVYGLESLDFEAQDIADIEAADLDRLPDFKTEKWLRLEAGA